ncbi:MAG: primosomal protein N' [Pseudomonadota bacterium]
MNNPPQSCLTVAVALPVKETFFYSLPDHLISRANIGCRVLVPLRGRKVTGYILEKRSEYEGRELKDILDVFDQEPLFHGALVPFFQWMADYYLFPIGLLIQSALPSGINVRHYKTAKITEKGLRALNALATSPDEKRVLTWVKNNPAKRPSGPFKEVYPLQKKGWVIIEDRDVGRRIGPLIRKFVKIKETLDPHEVLLESGNDHEFLKTILDANGILLTELSFRFKNGSYLVRKWIEKGVLVSYAAPVFRNPAGEIMGPSSPPQELYDQQKDVLSMIQEGLRRKGFSTCLLYGVTGSGKTEVYYHAVKHVMGTGKQTLLMVPEISLAIYTAGIFRSRLGDRVAIYHSGLSEGERYDQWRKMARGEVDLVIGARSALFAPLPNLGLIIVDEEHDFSYKQEEGPRYQARDAAVVRGRMEKALVILGSGTPSIQSFYNAVTGRYRLLSMPDRVEKRPLPNVRIVDMKKVLDGRWRESLITSPLKDALRETMAKGKQAILFLNRRGFHRILLCGKCGQSVRCRNCDVALIHHLEENRLACHYCGFYTDLQTRCPSCGHKGLRAYGFGTERLEKELSELFPERRIARLDRDITRIKGRSSQILKKFSRQEIDLLVGTQMITKGYDFPNVTLVGVIAADLSLTFPDFRAGERTFQILSQVGGRAGRGSEEGEVIVQTFNPDHYAIAFAREHDYPSFFHKEKTLREQLLYPPFSYLACLRLQGNSEKMTSTMAQNLTQGMAGILKGWTKKGKEIHVLGPVEAPLTKLKGKYRWQILLKSKGSGLLHYFLRDVEVLSKSMLKGSGVTLVVDMDPYQML